MAGQEPDEWRVYFLDGKEPLKQYFKNAAEDLRLVRCPHKAAEPRFVPSSSIMD
jgi:hypothetical protein